MRKRLRRLVDALVPMAVLAACEPPAPAKTPSPAASSFEPAAVHVTPASPPASAVSAASVVAASPSDPRAACRAAVAARFRPSAAWSAPWTFGPADRSPYADCHPWWDGSPPLVTPVAPPECRDARGGWAGISMTESLYDWALSDDGLTMARCEGTCDVLRVRDGRVLVHAGGGPGARGIDGTPAAEMPANAALFRKYGLSTTSAPWPVRDVVLDWSLAPRGAAVTYHLRDRASNVEVPIARIASRHRYVFPGRFVLSKNGLTLVVTAATRGRSEDTAYGGSQDLSYEDAVVDLPAAVTLLYLEAAAAAPDDTALDARARAACAALH